MTLDNLKIPAAELLSDVEQLQDHLLPLAQKPEVADLFSSALRRWYSRQLPSTLKCKSGYIVDDDWCSSRQDIVLMENSAPSLYGDSTFSVLPIKGIKVVIRIISGSLPEPALVKRLREFAVLGKHLRKQAGEEVALAIWAPEAGKWSKEEVWHLIQLIGETNPMAYTTHLALGSLYFQLTELQNENSDYQSFTISCGVRDRSAYFGGAMLANALLEHINHAYSYPFAGMLDGKKEAAIVAPSGMSIPSKNMPIRSANFIPVKGKSVTLPGSFSSPVPANRSPFKRKPANTNKAGLEQIQQDSEGNTNLHQLVIENKSREVKQLLEKSKVALSIKNKEGNTPLHLAVRLGFRSILGLLLEFQPEIDAPNYVYSTPLHLAVEEGHNEIVQDLLQAGAEIEVRNNLSQTPLHLAAIKGRINCGQQLCSMGADIRAHMEKGMEPIHLAAWYGEGEMVQTLLQTGAGINVQNEDGNTPLHFAAFNGQVKAIKVLINHGADPSLKNYTGLTYLDGFKEGYQGDISRLLE